MPEVIDDFEELIKKIQGQNLRIITIDGLDGIGKTTTANKLACYLIKNLEVRVEIINLDLFLRRNLNLFRLKIGMLRNILKEILNSSKENIVIIEGLLMREVMEKLRRVTTHRVNDNEICHIYCKKKSSTGLYDGFYEKEKCEDLIINGYKPPMLQYQLLKYHKKFEPCSKVCIIYVIPEKIDPCCQVLSSIKSV